MTWSLRNPKTERLGKIESGFKLDLGQGSTADTDEIIDVAGCLVLSTVAMKGARTRDSSVKCAGKRWYSGAIEINHRPYNALSRQGCCPIPEAECPVQKHLASPPNREKDGCHWVEKKPTVPPSKVDFPDMDTLPGVPLTSRLNKLNDSLRSWESELPFSLPVKMGINVAIDALPELATVDNCTSDLGILLLDSVSRAAIDLKRKIFLLEWSDQGAELELLVNVGLDVLLEQRRALQIPLGVLRVGNSREGDIPAELKPFIDLVCIKITPKGLLPDVKRKGGEFEWFSETVHVWCESGFAETPGNTLNALVFDGLARTLRRVMARTQTWRFRKIIRFVEPCPKSFVNMKFLEIIVVCISRIANHKVNIVTRRWMNRKREELMSKRIEASLRPRTRHRRPGCQRRITSRMA